MEESEGFHTGKGETRYLSGSTERVQEEELKRQQNRNRNSEEGLQSGGEGKQRGLGMAPDRLVTGTDAGLSHPHSASGTSRQASWGPAKVSVQTHTHIQTHAPCIMLQDTCQWLQAVLLRGEVHKGLASEHPAQRECKKQSQGRSVQGSHGG